MRLRVRRLAALAVLVTYAWPLTLGALADLSHGVHHVADTLREREARAAAFGVGHLGDEARFSHSHGGEAHSHSSPVDALLAASDGTGDEPDEGLVPIVVLSIHAPTTVSHVVTAPQSLRFAVATHAVAAEHARSAPPLPPPRA